MDEEPLEVLPEPAPDAVKGESGEILVVSGSHEYSNTPAIVSLSALRTGVDLVHVASVERPADITASYALNLITHPLKGKKFLEDHVEKVLELSKNTDCIAIGPGLGRDDETLPAVRRFLEERETPAVIDADALHALEDGFDRVRKNDVLTPHRGEFRELTGEDIPEQLGEKEDLMESWAGEVEATILLKGPTDFIASPDRLVMNSVGNPYMARGGTGDVLTGLTAAFISQGVPPFESAYAASYLNGLAGDQAVNDHGRGFLLEEMIEKIGEVLRRR